MFGKNRNKGFTTARYVHSNSNNSISNNYALTAQQLMQASRVDDIDTMMGFERYTAPQFNGKIDPEHLDSVPGRVGWLLNMHPTIISQEIMTGTTNGKSDGNLSGGIAGVDYYFLDEEGGSFKSTITYDPYFFISCIDDSMINDVEEFIKKYLENCLKSCSIIMKDDLKMDNHLLGLKKTLIKLEFVNSNQLFEARKLLKPILTDNENNKIQRNVYDKNRTNNNNNNNESTPSVADAKQFIEDIREYDVPYHVRVSIDKDIRIGKWLSLIHI